MKTSVATLAMALTAAAVAAAQSPPAPGPQAGAASPPARRSLLGRVPDPAAAPQAPIPGLTPTPAAEAPAPVDPEVRQVEVQEGQQAERAARGKQVFKSDSVLPEPAAVDEAGKPKIALPAGPIEPYLLRRHNGPFMVMAHTFQGPDAAKYAQALAMELRSKYRLPAYVYYLRFQPGRSNIRGVPPTAAPAARDGESVQAPERYRSYDEAAVLVGDCKTIADSEKLLHQVKKLHSDVLDGLPSIWKWRARGVLCRAMLTTNPLVASQELFPDANRDRAAAGHVHPPHLAQAPAAAQPGQVIDPGVLTAGFQAARKPDPLLKQMNSGPRSLYHCPGPFVLEVAAFLGRTTTDPNDPRFQAEGSLRQSPLGAAADQAEHLAESLGQCKSLPADVKAYAFHDRTSSRVYLGPFQSPEDPKLKQLLAPRPDGVSPLNEVSMELLRRDFTRMPLAPANSLMPVPES